MVVNKKGLDFRALSARNDLTWSELAAIPWDNVPTRGTDEFDVHARSVAGKVRDFSEFYTPEWRTYAMSVENWLIRYSRDHTHPSLRI